MNIQNPYAYGTPNTDPLRSQTEAGRNKRHNDQKTGRKPYTNGDTQNKGTGK